MSSISNVYAPRGRIDASNAGAAERDVLALLERSGPSIIIDLSKVDYVSSAGLRVLLLAAKTARGKGGKAAIVAPQAMVLEVLRMSGFDKIIPVTQTVEEAEALVAA